MRQKKSFHPSLAAMASFRSNPSFVSVPGDWGAAAVVRNDMDDAASTVRPGGVWNLWR